MYEYFGGVAKILVPDNCKTAVVHNGGWKDQQINETYQAVSYTHLDVYKRQHIVRLDK